MSQYFIPVAGRLVALLMLSVAVCPTAMAVDRYVQPGDAPLPDGGIIVYPNIQAAIDDSANGDVIYVMPGTYIGTGNCNLDFGGRAITLRSSDPNDPNVVAATVIDCQADEASPARGFIFQSGEAPNSIVAGLTITNGYGPADEFEGQTVHAGGAVACFGSSPTMTECTFVDNLAEDYGGAIYCRYGGLLPEAYAGPIISGCTFVQNEAGAGGAIHNRVDPSGGVDPLPTISDCTFMDNLSTADGGAICGRCTLSDCDFIGNAALGTGGAISGTAASGCTFVGNSAERGGAISRGGPIERCLVAGGSAVANGGGLYCESETTVQTCTVANNTAGVNGGGIYYRGDPRNDVSTGPMPDRIFNSSIVNNQAGQDGGGVHFTHFAGVYLGQSTISDNTAGGFGGGVYADLTKWTFDSTIVWGNTAGLGPEAAVTDSPEVSGGTIEFMNSDIQGGPNGVYADPNWLVTWSGGDLDVNPGFVDPDGADNDPNTWEDNDYHLSAGSACIGTGHLSLDYPAIDEDIDGQPRVMGSGVDMGCDEYPEGPNYYALALTIKKPDRGDVQIDSDQPQEPPFDALVYPAGTSLTLTAQPLPHTSFKRWKIYDPNYPGDAGHAITDTNTVLSLTLDADWQVVAIFTCAGGVELAVVMVAAASVLACAAIGRYVRGRRATV